MTERCDIVVVGGGLAGLHAAARAAQCGRSTVAFAGVAPGGLLLSIESVQGVPGHPEGIPGYDLGPMAQEAAMDAGARCLGEAATRIERTAEGWRVTGESTTTEARALVLAMGSHLRTLGVPGEERLFGKGVSHCASCDGPMLRGHAVAVVGGGDAACQEALTLAAFASRVFLLVRGSALRARAAWQERVAAQPKIEVRLGAVVEEIVGEGTVAAVRLARGDVLPVEAVFVYAGLAPANELLKTPLGPSGQGAGTSLAALDADGRVLVDAHLHTSAPGALAAGTLRAGHDGQAAQAIADGSVAAEAAHRFLQTGQWPEAATLLAAAPSSPTSPHAERTTA